MAITTAPAIKWSAELTLTPTSAATDITVQNFSYSAARPEDMITYQTPDTWASAGFVIVNAHCTSASNIALSFLNRTGAGYAAAAGVVRLYAL